MLKLFLHEIKGLTIAELFIDAVVVMLAFAAAIHPLQSTQAIFGVSSGPGGLLGRAAVLAAVMWLMYSSFGLYRAGAIQRGLPSMLTRATLAVVMGAVLAWAALVADGHKGAAVDWLGRWVLYMAAGAACVRLLSYSVRSTPLVAKRVLIVGTGMQARRVADDLRAAGHAQTLIVGFYPAGTDAAAELPAGKRVFSTEQSLQDLVREHKVDEIIVAVKEQRGGGVPMDQLLACRVDGVRVLDLAAFHERTHGEVPVDSVKASYFIYGHGFAQNPLRTLIKRCFDVVGATVLLIATAPIILLAMLAIRLEGPGPVTYSQPRVGLGGRAFNCMKLRTMRTDAEKDGVARWATKGDSRITRVGAFLRKTRIDELLQLFTVLKGDLSLVGPRPERPEFVAMLREQIPYYDIRHSMKPGVTGWAQVRYGYCATTDDQRRKHQFDLYYVKNHSVWMDVLILIETISVVLFREGAQ